MSIFGRLSGTKKTQPTERPSVPAERPQPQSATPSQIPCDLCGSAMDGTQTNRATADELRNAVAAGFSIRAITWGPQHARVLVLTQVGAAKGWSAAAMLSINEAEWKRAVMCDETIWNCCPRCYGVLQQYKQPASEAYRLKNPKLYSGFPVESLRRLIIHIPEKDSGANMHPDFLDVLSDTTGVPAMKVIGSVGTVFVTESHMGDEVQKTGKLPKEATDPGIIGNQEMRDAHCFEQQARTFLTQSKGRYGLFVCIYELK